MKFVKKVHLNDKRNSELVYNYLNSEKKYLECIYFQVLRDSKNDEFTEYDLCNFLSFSDYLHKKIFRFLNKNTNKSNSIKFEDFSNCITKLFSLYSSEEEEMKKNELIFNLISEANEILTFCEIKEFLNNLIYEIFCKAKLTNYESLTLLCRKVNKYFKNIFNCNCYNIRKNSKISKEEFCKIFEKNTELKNFILYLLNLISPKNEKLLQMVSKNDNNFYINDDFETDYEMYNTEENTPRINSISDYKDKEIFEDKKSNLFKEKSCFHSLCKDLFRNDFKKDIFSLKFENSDKKEESCQSTDVSSKRNSESLNLEENTNPCKNDFEENKNVIKKLNFNKCFSEDIFDIFDYERISKNRILNFNIENQENPNIKSKFYSGIRKKENGIEFSPNSVKTQTKDNDTVSKQEEIQNVFHHNKYSWVNNDCNKKLFESIKNEQNNDLIKILLYLHKKIKENHFSTRGGKKFDVIFLKEEIINNNFFLNKNNNAKEKEIKCNNNHLIKNKFNFNKSFYMMIKFIENELIMYNIKKAEDNSKDSENPNFYYFYKVNDLIFEPLPTKESSLISIFLDKEEKFYFFYEFSNRSSKYKIFFENYPDLISFHTTAIQLSDHFSKASSFIYKNKYNHFHLIQNSINFDFCYKKFSYIFEIYDQLSKKKFKIQLFNKKYLQENKFKLLFSSLFSLCRLNNFFYINIFPITNIYENNSFFIVEYSSEDCMVEYESKSEQFKVSIFNLNYAEYYKMEVERFKYLVKMLNLKSNVNDLFELLNLQKAIIYS